MVHGTAKESKLLLCYQLLPICLTTQFLFSRVTYCEIQCYIKHIRGKAEWCDWPVVLVSGWAGDYILMGWLNLIYGKNSCSDKVLSVRGQGAMLYFHTEIDSVNDPTQNTSLNLSIWTQSRILKASDWGKNRTFYSFHAHGRDICSCQAFLWAIESGEWLGLHPFPQM